MIQISSPITQLDNTYPIYAVGTRLIAKNGNEYIYLPGTTSVAQYDWVTYKAITATSPGMSYGSVTRMTTSAGLVGIAQGVATSNKYGWFQIGGIGWANAGGVCASGSPIYSSGTTATVTTTAAASYNVMNAFACGDGQSGGTVKVSINHPYLNLAVL